MSTKCAPLAQPDRVFGYEPKGQGFESLTARQNKKKQAPSLFLFVLPRYKSQRTPIHKFASQIYVIVLNPLRRAKKI